MHRQARLRTTGRGLLIRSIMIASSLQLMFLLVASAVPNQAVEDPPALAARERRPSDVYLDDSLEAADVMKQAQRLTNRGNWRAAAELLQQTSDREGDQLLALAPDYYVGVRRHIADHIASWPLDGVRAYQARFEPDIAAAVERLHDSVNLTALLQLFEQYFCTEGAARLADRIGEVAIESGRFQLARTTYERVLNDHPNRASYEKEYSARRALARLLETGDAPAPADRTLRLSIAGKEMTIEELYSDLPQTFPDVVASPANDAWPVFGGDLRRNRQAHTTVNELGRIWRSGFAPPDEQQDDISLLTATRDQYPRDLAVNPVFGEERIFVQTNIELIAFFRQSGVTAWRHSVRDRRLSDSDDIERLSRWNAPTLHGDRVYAAFAHESVPFYGSGSDEPRSTLVCLDSADGRVIWSSSPQQPGVRPDELHLDSSPIVTDGRVAVVGRRRRAFGFEDCYLYQFDRRDGRQLQSVHLGGASTGSFGSRRATLSMPSLDGNAVYVCSNLGSIARVCTFTGRVDWLRLYARGDDESLGSRRSRNTFLPWARNALICEGDKLYALPNDSSHILVLDTSRGEIVQSIATSDVGRLESLLGVVDGRIYGVGQQAVCFDTRAMTTVWSSSLPQGSTLWGRGQLLEDRLLIPTQRTLSAFDLETGEREDLHWPAGEYGGNVLAAGNQLFVTGARTLTAYVRKQELYAQLRARMAQDTSDPTPALDLAELALVGGDYDEALAALDAAIERARAETAVDQPVARRIFNDLLESARAMAAASLLDRETLDRLYDSAGRQAYDSESNLVYRIHFATLYEEFGLYDRAVEIYQQLLRDRTLRELPAPRQAGQFANAGEFARTRIAEVIESRGRAVYARFDEEAEALLGNGISSENLDLIEQVTVVFPNAQVLPQALQAAGELLMKRGEPEQAVRRFSKAYHRFSNQSERMTTLPRICKAYQAAQRPEYAYLWASKAAALFPGALIEVDGQSIPISSYRDSLAQHRDRVEPSWPTMNLPLDEHTVQPLGESASVLRPVPAPEPGMSWGSFYVYDDGAVQAYDAQTQEPIWPEPATVQQFPKLILVDSLRVVLQTSHEVFALDRSSGARLWTAGEFPAGMDDPDRDWEPDGEIRAVAIDGNRIVLGRPNEGFECIELTDGKVLWTQSYDIPVGQPVALKDDVFVCAYMREGQTRVGVIDASSGDWVGEMTTGDDQPADALFVDLNDNVVVVTARSIVGFDAVTLLESWRRDTGRTIRRSSLQVDWDALYYSTDGERVRKVSLFDGAEEWTSDRLPGRSSGKLSLLKVGQTLIAASEVAVTGLDAVSGRILWEGTPPDRPRFAFVFLTDRHVVAVSVPKDPERADPVAIFYDHRNGSGIVPAEGGYLPLKEVTPASIINLANDMLLIQSGTSLHVYARAGP